jgi:hypothetical protein
VEKDKLNQMYNYCRYFVLEHRPTDNQQEYKYRLKIDEERRLKALLAKVDERQ